MSDILVERSENIIHVTFNRPAKKNSITIAMYQAMYEAIEEAENDKSVRAVFFKGTEGCFSAGNDLQDFMAAGSASDFNEDVPVLRFIKLLITTSVPVIAAVDGLAIGIGTTLLLHCDQVVVSKSAMMKMPFAELALVPEAASSYMLPQKVGYTRAADLILGCRALSGTEAVDWGMASYLTDDFESCQKLGLDLALAYNNRPPEAVRKSKKLLKGNVDEVLKRFREEAVEFGKQLMSAECHEAVMAFMERRKPDWSKFG